MPADIEIRESAIECLRQLRSVAPNLSDDVVIRTLPDGSEVADSPLAERVVGHNPAGRGRCPAGVR